MPKKEYLISAIVSVYNSERFIIGCLEDLEQQTIVDKLEIVLVNSGSQQNEEAIIKKFQEKYNNILYIKTENRETIYQAWNRGIKASAGKFITNANTDDRHRKDAFEIMVNFLENNADIDLVYADDIITEHENDTFEKHTAVSYLNWPEFDRYNLFLGCFIGPHPVWRRKLHEKFGFFDESLRIAGDYEFWLRLSEKCTFKHIKEYLGLYLRNPHSAERKNRDITILETEKTINKYIKAVANNKKLFVKIKRWQNELTFELGFFYFQNKRPFFAMKAFHRGMLYSWNNFTSYKRLVIFFLPSCLIKLIIEGKKYFKRIII
jgi:glycosyltransferase involved in cell wall biosynthesis